MKIKTFDIFGSKWRIIFADMIEEHSESFIFGSTDAINKIIYIATKGPDGKKIEDREIKLTLIHELIHAMCDECLYKNYSSDEPFVEWMAKCILTLKEQKIL